MSATEPAAQSEGLAMGSAGMDRVLDLNTQIDLRRLPRDPSAGPAEVDNPFDLEWLYRSSFDQMVEG